MSQFAHDDEDEGQFHCFHEGTSAVRDGRVNESSRFGIKDKQICILPIKHSSASAR